MQGAPESAPRPINASTPETREGFAPLPLRARGVLEILDTSIKVYKQYFWVLVGWSSIVSVASQLQIIALFLWPLIVGACVCCITAAVRGQAVQFNQCGQFSYPRYGRLIGTMFFAVLIFIALIIALAVGGVFAGIALMSALQALPTVVQVVFGIVLFLLFVLAASMSTVWLNLALIVVCMEEGKSGPRAMGRAFELLRGYWVRVCTLITLLSFGMVVLMAILWGFGMIVFGVGHIPDLFSGQMSEGWLAFTIVSHLVSALLGTFFNPILYLTLGLFYLDLRIRKEALDIEWGAHVSTQASIPVQPFTPPSHMTGVWAPESDLSLQQGEPSFRAALASVAPPTVAPTPPPLTAERVTPEQQQAWFGAPTTPAAPTPAAPAAPVNAAVPPADSFLAQTAPPVNSEPPAPATPPVGEALASLVCIHCGSTSPANQAFCMNCGSRLQQPGDSPAPSASSTPPTW